MTVPYEDDDDHPGEPHKTKTGSISIAKNVGPLPVWGWGVVAIAAVLLYRKIGGKNLPASQAANVVGTPAYVPASTGANLYLLPTGGAAAPGGTGSSPAPAPAAPAIVYPSYPNGGAGQAPAGGACAAGRTLIQGPNGYTCATGPEAIALGQYLGVH